MQFQKEYASTSTTPSTHLTAAFVVAISTVALSGAANTPLNQSRQKIVTFFDVSTPSKALTTTPVSEEAFKIKTASASPEMRGEQGPHWMQDSLDRIEKLGNLPENWGGEGYKPASEAAVVDAERFFLKLVHAGLSKPPSIGLDDDGSFSFHISENNFVADLSVHADGTYSYYAQHGSAEIFSEDSLIDGPIDQKLVEFIEA